MAYILCVLSVSPLALQLSFEEALKRFEHPNPKVRLRALRLLKDASYPEAAGPLAVLLTDPDNEIQLEAIDTEIGLFMADRDWDRRRVAKVFELWTGNLAERAFAGGPSTTNGRPAPPEVLTGLAAAIRDDSSRVRLEALYAFGVLAPLAGEAERAAAMQDAVPWIAEALRRETTALRVAAAQVSGRVLEGCGTPPAAVRRAVAPARAGASGPPQETPAALCDRAGEALINGINDPDKQVRFASVRALGELRYPMAVQALTDQFNYYRRGEAAVAALDALARIAHPSSVPLLESLLTSKDSQVRTIASAGISRAGGRPRQP